ncbi:uncharacterized protein LOC126629929 [Malus sylvestris]|uniref:uncharacterized protein n=1 Tax=Malus domestica TaxID=3750 RepID=UPI0021ABAA80|nr:uncharacterized protein LOC126607496 [Malus sylvestris]XP_050156041.1 uncharacterized protein LOC126629929 [Malus sylvestris]
MSSSRRVYKQLQEQQQRLLAQQAELANLEEGGGGDEAFFMEEDEDDHHRRQKASHSRRVMEAVGQIAKPRRVANLDRKREKRGLIPEQKITASLRMLAYGASADQVDEIARMGKTTVLESLMRFCSAIEALYTKEYLRTPTSRDMRRLLRKGEMRGFPGMIGSIDCMHWTWKNCPSAWQGAYGDRKGAKSIILEAVASFDTWIWHAFFGVPGAQNDLNVLAQSPVFDELLQGNSPRCTYWVNGTQYEGSYYLADGIYPRWSTFVKTVPHPQTEKEKHFAKCQEGCRKDVERCFGILQARWAIVRAAARMFDVEALRSIMMTCIILHNMIVEDEYDYDAVDEYEPDPMNNSRTRIYCAHDGTEDPVQHEPLERDGRYNELIVQRYTNVQEPYWHVTRQNDLIEHQWGLHGGEDN